MPSPLPETKHTAAIGKHPFRQSQPTTDLQNSRNQPDLQFPVAQGFTMPQNVSSAPSATPTPRNLSRQASPTGFQGPSSKRRKQSGVSKVPTGLTMTKLETTPQPSSSASTTPSNMPMSHFSPNNQPFRIPAERGYAIPSNNHHRLQMGHRRRIAMILGFSVQTNPKVRKACRSHSSFPPQLCAP